MNQFVTRQSKHSKRCAQVCTAVLCCVFLFGGYTAAYAAGFTILNVKTKLVDKVYRLSARLDYELSTQLYEALQNGLPITIDLDIEILRPRPFYLWSETIAKLKQQNRLQYHALSNQYVVKNLNTGVQTHYQTVDAAIASLERVEGLPILDQSLLDKNQHYIVRLHTGVDIESLPVPLRLFAYISSGWRLSSGWFSRPLTL
jgi:hypothetical protein